MMQRNMTEWKGSVLDALALELMGKIPFRQNFTQEDVQQLICDVYPFLSRCGSARSVSHEESTLRVINVCVGVLFGTVLSLGLVGNLGVIAAISQNRRLRSTTSLLICNLAVTDLLFLTVCVPTTCLTYFSNDAWRLGDAWCKFVQYCIHVTAYVSVYTLVLMSVDRFLAVVHPLSSKSFRTRTNAVHGIFWTWFVMLAVCAPEFVVYGVAAERRGAAEEEERPSCQFLADDYNYPLIQTAFFCCSYFIPLFVIICLYFKILRRVHRAPSTSGRSHECQHRRRRVTRMVVVIIFTFSASWCPIQVLLLLKSLSLFQADTFANLIVQIVAQCLAYTNSSVNPLLYAFFTENFLRSLRTNLLKRKSVAKALRGYAADRITLEDSPCV